MIYTNLVGFPQEKIPAETIVKKISRTERKNIDG